MSIWNKVLLVLIFLCVATFVYFGADALKMRRESHKKLADARALLVDEQEKNRKLLFGTGQGDGYVSLVNEVDRLRAFRGTRAWPNCLPTAPAVVKGTMVTLQLQVDAQPATPVAQPDDESDPSAAPPASGNVALSGIVAPATPPQDRVLPGTVVYLFDKRPIADGGCLLGEFTVVKVDIDVATLTSVYSMTPAEIQRINDSVARVAPWAVYTVLPRVASTALLVGNAEQTADIAPATSESAEIDFADNDASSKFVAQPLPQALPGTTDDLRPALAQTFASLNRKRQQLLNIIESQKIQKADLEATQIKATEMIEFYNLEIEDTQVQNQETRRQFAEVKKLYDATVAEIVNIEYLIANLKLLNKKILADLTQTQLRASEIIHEQNASLTMAP